MIRARVNALRAKDEAPKDIYPIVCILYIHTIRSSYNVYYSTVGG
jgi:hypothetical protein